MVKKEFYLTECSDDTLVINFDEYLPHNGVCSIVWFNQGLYGVIRKETISNMIIVITDRKKTKPDSPAKAKIHWDETLQIDSKLATILIGSLE